MHTRNSEATLGEALASVAWADDLLVADMASVDGTLDIAARHGARILKLEPGPRVDVTRNHSSAQARHEWVFMLDSDEYVAADAETRIAELLSEHANHCDVFGIPRYNVVGGQVLRGGRWYPDHQLRLFRKGRLQWEDATHERPVPTGGPSSVIFLEPPDCLHLHHDSYASLSNFIEKQLRYALLDRYPGAADAFSFQDYIAAAYERLAGPGTAESDGDLARALSLVLAWDQVIRGVLHWEQLEPRPPLGPAFSLPLVTTEEAERADALEQACEKLARTEAELAAVKGTLAWKTHAALVRRFPRLVGALSRRIRN